MGRERCQLYSYSATGYSLAYNTPSHFSSGFRPEDETDQTHWLNFHTTLCVEEINELCANLGVDQITAQDIYMSSKQRRPKLEEYPNYIFFGLQSARYKTGSNTLFKENISFILGDNYLVSFQEKSSDHFTSVRERIERKKGKIRDRGPEYLLFRMLEAIMDNYFEVLDHISTGIGAIECGVKSQDTDLLEDIETNKRRLVELKKIVIPIREITSQFEKTDSHFIDAENLRHFSDLKDSCMAILDEIEYYGQVLDGLSNMFFAVQGQKMNEIMKLLTLVSSVFIPLTFIAGIYGMNFENMPELRWKYGYYAVWAAIAVITAALLLLFRKKGWMKNGIWK